MLHKPAVFLAVAAAVLLAGLGLAGCRLAAGEPAPAAATRTPRPGSLVPFATRTPTPTLTPTHPATPTPLPSPTPTPRTHVIAKGDDMFGIAWRYRVTLEELMAANPEVNPNLMIVGETLVIPAANLPEPSSEPPTPTPIPLETGRLRCTRSADGGAWCFWPVRNPHDYPLENITAIFRLADQNAQNIQPVTAFLPLDLLPPGAALPLVAYYAPPVPEGFQASAELLTVLPNPAGDGRYLAARLSEQQVMIAENGRSASVTAQVQLADGESAAQRVWVAAVAYDADDQVVGVRRWENDELGPLGAGQSLPVILQVYSQDGAIERVELFAEARP